MFKNKTYFLLLFLFVLFVAVVSSVSYILVPKFPSINYLGFLNQNQPGADSAVSNFKIDEDTDLFPVLSVTDGDTIKIDYYGKTESVRLVGLDAPEMKGEDNTCYSIEAREYLNNLLVGQNIKLEADQKFLNRDTYNRLLRYVFLNETNVNEQLILNGFAEEVTYNSSYKYQKEFKSAQLNAINGKLGIWSPSCLYANQE